MNWFHPPRRPLDPLEQPVVGIASPVAVSARRKQLGDGSTQRMAHDREAAAFCKPPPQPRPQISRDGPDLVPVAGVHSRKATVARAMLIDRRTEFANVIRSLEDKGTSPALLFLLLHEQDPVLIAFRLRCFIGHDPPARKIHVHDRFQIVVIFPIDAIRQPRKGMHFGKGLQLLLVVVHRHAFQTRPVMRLMVEAPVRVHGSARLRPVGLFVLRTRPEV
mmetsp:Transcript_58162/g.162149  ORF Transcript_58162/g.162149 Transcript_58162/m.162149 type:complete len:219 (+) Transcript_58162:226-882(+)